LVWTANFATGAIKNVEALLAEAGADPVDPEYELERVVAAGLFVLAANVPRSMSSGN
jgi:hypothetical protein